MSSASAVLAVNVLDPHSLLSSFGPIGVAVVMFAETGLLIGFFLPGDSLLFTAGVRAAAPASAAVHVPLVWVLVAASIGACLGAQVGYLIGRRAGPPLFDSATRPRLRHGRERAAVYLARYGFPADGHRPGVNVPRDIVDGVIRSTGRGRPC